MALSASHSDLSGGSGTTVNVTHAELEQDEITVRLAWFRPVKIMGNNDGISTVIIMAQGGIVRCAVQHYIPKDALLKYYVLNL